MRFSTRTRYGLRFLLHLAAQPEGDLIKLEKIAQTEGIPFGYLEQIVRLLQPLYILKTSRGAKGGYSLSKPPKEINLEDVIAHLEGGHAIVPGLHTHNQCEEMGATKNFWEDFNGKLWTYLRSKNLEDLLIFSGDTMQN